MFDEDKLVKPAKELINMMQTLISYTKVSWFVMMTEPFREGGHVVPLILKETTLSNTFNQTKTGVLSTRFLQVIPK